ncbi:hypothetical protein [Actinomadura gamaensis]|uniref:Transposase n=1 Tax=Actinomadura gamaensis TaxID=1763541 RepID=A0ABV9TWP6_9ACTN
MTSHKAGVPSAWVRSECARRFPTDDRRRHACEVLLARVMDH